MPTYTFLCKNCNSKVEIFYSMKDYDENTKCRACNKPMIRSYQDDLLDITGSVIKNDSELKTLGDLANRNRDRMSGEQKDNLYTQHNKYKEDFHLKLPSGMSRIPKASKYGR